MGQSTLTIAPVLALTQQQAFAIDLRKLGKHLATF
jgi:hypothetical protein